METRLCAELSIEKVTVAILKEYLQSQSLPTSGRKLDLALRAVKFLDRVDAEHNPEPVATDYIDDEDDIEDVEDSEAEEEEVD